uniref:Uncharacterized protein n=1 Tax=Glossina brevipalpis TaxID=37001 RepID=A0A1A9W0Q0_9MUSC
MISTAVKEKDYHESDFLTPVRYLESPKVQSITSDSNLNACRARLDSIMKTIQDDFSKWLLAERRGLALCNAIETIKTRTLVAVTASENDKVDSTLYPNDLASHCHKLSLIVCIFQDIVANAKNFLKQIKSLSKLQGSSQKILFRSWSLNQFIDFLTELTQRYEEEYQIKKHTMGKP